MGKKVAKRAKKPAAPMPKTDYVSQLTAAVPQKRGPRVRREPPELLRELARTLGDPSRGKAAIVTRLLPSIPHRELLYAWEELEKWLPTARDWQWFIGEVEHILHQTRKYRSAREVADDAIRVANAARALSGLMEQIGIDPLAYEVVPAEVMEVNGILDWSALDPLTRDDAARSVMVAWPSAIEMVSALADYAQRQAEQTIANRKVTRDRQQQRQNFAVRRLYDWLVGRVGEGEDIAPVVATVLRTVTGDEWYSARRVRRSVHARGN